MVQILPQQPSLGELLGSGLASGVQTGLQGKMQLMNQLALEEQKQQMKDEGMQNLLSSLGLGGGVQEQPSMQQQESQAQQQVSPEQNNEMQLEKIATNPALMLNLANKNPQMATQIQSMYSNLLAKRKEEKKDEFVTPKTQERLKSVFQRQSELMKGGNIGMAKTPSAMLTEKGREDRAEFDTLSSSIEAALLPLVSKGTLAKQRFEYLMSLLPKSRNTLAANRGKIKALKREFGLLEKEGILEDQTDKKTEKPLDKEMAMKYLKAAGGDKEKARKMAKKSGFNF